MTFVMSMFYLMQKPQTRKTPVNKLIACTGILLFGLITAVRHGPGWYHNTVLKKSSKLLLRLLLCSRPYCQNMQIKTLLE